MAVRWLAQLETDLAETVGGTLLRGARAVPVGLAAGATTRPTTAPGALVGYGIRNLSDVAAATVLLRDGSDAAGDLVMPLELAPGESARDWFGPGGIGLSQGLYVDVAAGSVDGAVYLRGAE